LEVLSRSPGVLVNQQQNSITLNGREGVMVMINNTLSRMPMESVMQLLEGMSAANVEKIELISQPPSHLDAEGGSGVIHIVMKENTEQGTNGGFGLSVGRRRGEDLGANFNLNHRGNSFSTFVEYSYLQRRNRLLWINGFRSEGGITRNFHADTDRSDFSQTHQFRAGFEKTFHTNTEIGAYFNLNRTNNTYVGEGESILQTGDSLVLGDIWYGELKNIQNRGAHLHVSHQLNAKHRFRMDYDWVNLQLDNLSTYDNTIHHDGDTTKFVMDIDSHTPMNFHITALDYQFQPSPQWNIKAGVKKTWMNFENSVQSFSDRNGIRQLNPFISLSALMKENISAAYVSGDWNLGDHLQLKAGLRYEHTETDIRLLEEGRDTTVYRNFRNIFPNLLIQKSLSEKSSVTMGFTRRINRPTLGQLVPVVLLINQNTEFWGNPELLPAFINNYKLDFKFNRASISLEHSHVRNDIARFQPRFDPDRELIIMTPENLRFLQNTGLFFTSPWIISEYCDLQSTAQVQRRSFETSHLLVNQRFSFYDLNLNLVNTFTMGNGYTAELGGFFQSNRNFGLWIYRPMGSLNLGLQKKLREGRGTLRLAVTDLLNTNNLLVDTHFVEPPLHTYVDFFLRLRTIMLNYTRPFGNKKLKTLKFESMSEEDRRRMVVD
jgi:hypothetical protein